MLKYIMYSNRYKMREQGKDQNEGYPEYNSGHFGRVTNLDPNSWIENST